MALSREDKSDVARSFGKKAASAVSSATRDKGSAAYQTWKKVNHPDGYPKSRALDSKAGKTKGPNVNGRKPHDRLPPIKDLPQKHTAGKYSYGSGKDKMWAD